MLSEEQRHMGNEAKAAKDEIAKWRDWLKKADGAFKPAYRAPLKRERREKGKQP